MKTTSSAGTLLELFRKIIRSDLIENDEFQNLKTSHDAKKDYIFFIVCMGGDLHF